MEREEEEKEKGFAERGGQEERDRRLRGCPANRKTVARSARRGCVYTAPNPFYAFRRILQCVGRFSANRQ